MPRIDRVFRVRGRSVSSGAAPVASRSGPRLTGAIGGLARFVAQARLGDWPTRSAPRRRRACSTGLPVGAAGARTRLPGQVSAMLDRTESRSGDGSAHRLLDGLRTAPGAAAFANGGAAPRPNPGGRPPGRPRRGGGDSRRARRGRTHRRERRRAARRRRGRVRDGAQDRTRARGGGEPPGGVVVHSDLRGHRRGGGRGASCTGFPLIAPRDALALAANLAGGLREFAVWRGRTSTFCRRGVRPGAVSPPRGARRRACAGRPPSWKDPRGSCAPTAQSPAESIHVSSRGSARRSR